MKQIRRKKRKPTKFFYLLLIVLIVFLAITFSGSKEKQTDNPKTSGISNTVNSSYSDTAVQVIKEYDIDATKYSKTLDVALTSGVYNKEYLDSYKKIEYVDNKSFITDINVFLEKKYTPDEINNIYKNFKDGTVIKLLKKDYLDLADYFSISNFDSDNYERYVNYMKDNKFTLQDVVTYVNIGLDKDFYTGYKEIKKLDTYSLLVNKYNKLPNSYEPKDLVSLTYNASYKMRSEAAAHFESMVLAAKKAGHNIVPYSAYRSYSRQSTIYTNYVNRDGQTKADTFSARPGFSEHQTGLAVDVRSSTEQSNLTDKDYKWVLDNSYKYGFIVRYPEGKISITGYKLEQWHLRYLGKDLATKVVNKKLTYDEYYDLYVKDNN